jgi:TolA-binding protein
MQFATIALAAGMAATPLTARAAVRGTIEKKDGTEIAGSISWFASSQEFDVNIGNVSTKVPAHLVARVVADRPPEYDQAVAQIKAKQFAAAVSPLKTIVKDYERMTWDVEAARWLAVAYLNLNQFNEAIEMCKKVIRANPDTGISGPLASVYWDALNRAGRNAELEVVLGEAVKTGSREVAAVAQLKRADIVRTRGDVKKALIDGYLRTAILFRDVKAVQPEALLKAAECCQQLGQQAFADKMRKELMEKFPESPEAAKVRAGGV